MRVVFDWVAEECDRAARQTRMVDLAGVSVVYQANDRNIVAVEDCSISVGKSEFVSILGPSGCGKSTLLRVIAGLMLPSEGSVLVGGNRVQSPRRDVGIVFQKPTLLPWKTVLANVLSPIQAHRRIKEADIARGKQMLALVLRHLARIIRTSCREVCSNASALVVAS